jgi:hypothetical protein
MNTGEIYQNQDGSIKECATGRRNGLALHKTKWHNYLAG